MVRLLFISFILFSFGCAGLPEGWEKQGASYVEAETGLVFPEKTSRLALKSVLPRSSLTNSSTIRYESSRTGMTMSFYVHSRGDTDYFTTSKFLMVKINKLTNHITIPDEDVSVTYKGKAYRAKVFRGYGKVVEGNDGGHLTILESLIVFEFDDFDLKVRTSGLFDPDRSTGLKAIKATETEMLNAVFSNQY